MGALSVILAWAWLGLHRCSILWFFWFFWFFSMVLLWFWPVSFDFLGFFGFSQWFGVLSYWLLVDWLASQGSSGTFRVMYPGAYFLMFPYIFLIFLYISIHIPHSFTFPYIFCIFLYTSIHILYIFLCVYMNMQYISLYYHTYSICFIIFPYIFPIFP